MSSRSFSDITQTDWLRAASKLGLTVETGCGKGSHVLVTNTKINKSYTVQHKLHKYINMKIFKKLLEWGIDEEKIWDALK